MIDIDGNKTVNIRSLALLSVLPTSSLAQIDAARALNPSTPAL